MSTNMTRWKFWRIDAAGAAVCLALSLALYLGGIRPLIRNHDDFVDQKAQLDEQRTRLDEMNLTLKAYRGQYETAQRELAQGALRLESTSNVNRRLADISALAVSCNLKINEIQPGRAVPTLHYQTVPIHLAGNGTYRTCTAFLHKLRKSFPDTSISLLELAGNPSDPSGMGTFRLDLQWHASPELSTATR